MNKLHQLYAKHEIILGDKNCIGEVTAIGKSETRFSFTENEQNLCPTRGADGHNNQLFQSFAGDTFQNGCWCYQTYRTQVAICTTYPKLICESHSFALQAV